MVSYESSDEEGLERINDLISAQQPRILAGIHFYLLGNFEADLSKNEITSLIKLCDGKVRASEVLKQTEIKRLFNTTIYNPFVSCFLCHLDVRSGS